MAIMVRGNIPKVKQILPVGNYLSNSGPLSNNPPGNSPPSGNLLNFPRGSYLGSGPLNPLRNNYLSGGPPGPLRNSLLSPPNSSFLSGGLLGLLSSPPNLLYSPLGPLGGPPGLLSGPLNPLNPLILLNLRRYYSYDDNNNNFEKVKRKDIGIFDLNSNDPKN